MMRVTDAGIRITPEGLKRLFQPFWQSAGLSRKYEGAVQGLTICKTMAGLMGNSIAVESGPGRDSDVCFSLPLGRGNLAC